MITLVTNDGQNVSNHFGLNFRENLHEKFWYKI